VKSEIWTLLSPYNESSGHHKAARQLTWNDTDRGTVFRGERFLFLFYLHRLGTISHCCPDLIPLNWRVGLMMAIVILYHFRFISFRPLLFYGFLFLIISFLLTLLYSCLSQFLSISPISFSTSIITYYSFLVKRFWILKLLMIIACNSTISNEASYCYSANLIN